MKKLYNFNCIRQAGIIIIETVKNTIETSLLAKYHGSFEIFTVLTKYFTFIMCEMMQ